MKEFIKKRIFILKLEELRKFTIIFIISNLVVFNFVMLKPLREANLLSNLGPQALPIAKIAFVMPASFIFMFLYNKLSNFMSARQMFIFFVSLFGLCFFIYAVIPAYNSAILAYLFVAISESWSTVVFGTCMWAFFNDICTVDQAKRFYVLVSGVQIGAIIGTSSSKWFVSTFGSHFDSALLLLISFFCLTIVFILSTFTKTLAPIQIDVEESNKSSLNINSLIRGFLTSNIFFITALASTLLLPFYFAVALFVLLLVIKSLVDYKGLKKVLEHIFSTRVLVILASIVIIFNINLVLSIISSAFLLLLTFIKSRIPLERAERSEILEGMKLIYGSKYLTLILILTIAYNFTIVVTEFIWNVNIKKYYVSKKDIFLFKTGVIFYTNLISSILSLFLSGGLINYVGIGTALTLFPLVFGMSTTMYFLLFMTPFTGAVQWILVKVSKYALADPAKQTLFIPTTKEERYKAKSVIDIVGARGGKAFASIFTLIFLTPIVIAGGELTEVMGKLSSFSYPILMSVTVIWIVSAIWISNIFLKYRKREQN